MMCKNANTGNRRKICPFSQIRSHVVGSEKRGTIAQLRKQRYESKQVFM